VTSVASLYPFRDSPAPRLHTGASSAYGTSSTCEAGGTIASSANSVWIPFLLVISGGVGDTGGTLKLVRLAMAFEMSAPKLASFV